MRNNLSIYTKAFASMTCSSLILISNNSELAARYLPNKEENHNKNKINQLNINQSLHGQIATFDFAKKMMYYL